MTTRYVTPAQWGMRPLDPAKTEHRALSVITEANVHHSDTPAPAAHAQCDDAARAIDNAHHANGWAGIGYHRVICPHRYMFEARPLDVVPAAAEGHNAHIIAYCLLGKAEPATAPAWAALLDAIGRDAHTLGHGLKLTTHREVEPAGYTECPGAGIEHQIQQWRAKHGNTVPPPAPPTGAPMPSAQRSCTQMLTAGFTARAHAFHPDDHRLVEALRAAAVRALGLH